MSEKREGGGFWPPPTAICYINSTNIRNRAIINILWRSYSRAAIYFRDIDTGGLGFPGVVIACSRFVAAIRWLPVVSFRAGGTRSWENGNECP